MGAVYENAEGKQRREKRLSYLKRRNADFSLEYLAVRELKKFGGIDYVCGEPQAVPIEHIIEMQYGISIEYHYLRKNFITLGQMVFEGGHVPIYDMENSEYTLIDVPPKTMLIDARLLENKRYANRLRFTYAHELSHYILHKEYFANLNEVPALIKGEENEEHDMIERQANLLSSYLLISTGQMKKAFNRLMARGESNDIVRTMADIFEVAPATMEIRMREHHLI